MLRRMSWAKLAIAQALILILPLTGLLMSSDAPVSRAFNAVVFVVGTANIFYILRTRRRVMPMEDKVYMWCWRKPVDYTGTRLMWFAEQAGVNLFGFVQRRAIKRELGWDALRISEGMRAMGAAIDAQRTDARMREALKNLTDSDAFAKMGEAFAGMAEAMGDAFKGSRLGDAAMAERENESKMRFHTTLRAERLKGRNAVIRMARDARRAMGLPLR